MEVIYSIFKWFVQAVGDIVNLITSIPDYVDKFVYIVSAYLPSPIFYIVMLCISAYIIIKIKRLVF